MSAFTKMMGWDQIKEDASMMKDQGQQLMGMSSDMFGRGKGFLTGKGDWYDNAMKSFGRSHMDAAGATGRNITQNFAAKGAGGGFASLINQNMGSQQRLGEASSGFFSGLYRQGAQIGSDLQRGAQGFSGQANQAFSKGADLSKSRSDISTGLLNSAIGLGGGLLMQGMANKGAMGIAQTMMGGTGQATAAASSSGGGGGFMQKLASAAPALLGGGGSGSTMASGIMGMKPTGPYAGSGPPAPAHSFQGIPMNQRTNYQRGNPSVSNLLQSGIIGGDFGASGNMYGGYNQGVNTNNPWNEQLDPYGPNAQNYWDE